MLRVSLQNKILLGYLLLVAVISSMTAILLHERKRMHEIEAETTEIRKIRKDINTVHRRITELATHGNLSLHGMRQISGNIETGD